MLTNRLTDALGVPGSSITVNLADPYMGPNSHTINNPDVTVNFSRSTGFYWQNVGVNIAAGLADFTRGLYQRDPRTQQPTAVTPTLYDLPHTQMDNLWPFGAVMP